MAVVSINRPERANALDLPRKRFDRSHPQGALFRQGDTRYESKFVQDGRKITVTRSIKVQRCYR
jgi:hypothetical protein